MDERFTLRSMSERTHWYDMRFGEGNSPEVPIPLGTALELGGGSKQAMEACRRLEERRYQRYRALRIECGFSDDHGYLHEKVWWGMDRTSQMSAINQMQAGATDKARQARKEQTEGWGDW